MTDHDPFDGAPRLAMLGFLRGQEAGDWIRYRGHSVERIRNADGMFAELAYLGFEGRPDIARSRVTNHPDHEYALATLAMFDAVIDARHEWDAHLLDVRAAARADAERERVYLCDVCDYMCDEDHPGDRQNHEDTNEGHDMTLGEVY